MLVQSINNNKTIGFGELYVNIPKIKKKVGAEWAKGVEESFPRLRELAQDVEVFIFPLKEGPEIESHGLDIQVYEKFPNFRNPIKALKFYWNVAYDKVHLKNREIREGENIADKIVQYVTDSKEFLQERI